MRCWKQYSFSRMLFVFLLYWKQRMRGTVRGRCDKIRFWLRKDFPAWPPRLSRFVKNAGFFPAFLNNLSSYSFKKIPDSTMIFIKPCNVSLRTQSRCNSQAIWAILVSFAPACSTRRNAVSCARTDVPPTASTTG